MQDADMLHIFEILAREHEPMLMAYILSLIADRTLAEDIAQQTLVVAFRKISTLEKTGSFPAWLRGIARLEVFSTLRKHQAEVPFDPAAMESMEESYRAVEHDAQAETWEERFKVVENCFNALPEAAKEVCRLHYFEDQKAREIADQLQLGLATVLKRLERARNAIRTCVENRLKAGAGYV